MIIAILVISTLLAFADIERNKVWENELTLYSDCISKTPDNSRAYYQRGTVRGNLGDYKGAMEDCGRAIELNPNDADAYYNRGSTKGRLSDYKGAIEDYNKVIELNPDAADAYYNRGTAKNILGNYKGAIEDWEKAIGFAPSYKEELQPLINRAKNKINK